MTPADFDLANEGWADGQESILAGHVYTEEHYVLVHVGAGGILFLCSQHEKQQFDMAPVEQLMPILQATLESKPRTLAPVVVDVESTPVSTFERERLLAHLRKNKWNIAHVARVLGVYRPSVYRQMRRLGIKREKPPKS